MSELISVVIVNWNGMKWIKKCLDSLSNQSYKNFEVIIIDNASTDGSAAYIRSNCPKVKLIQNSKNVGFGSGNNMGVKQAKGIYILLLNTDTWLESDFLEKILNISKQNNYSVIAPQAKNYKSKEGQNYITKIDPFGYPVYLYGEQYRNKKSFFLTGSCLFLRKQLFIDTKGFDENFFMYCEDIDWFWRLLLLGCNFNYTDKVSVYHAAGGSTGKGIRRNVFLWRNENTLQMLLKNYSAYNLLWVLPIYLLQNCFEFIFFLLLGKPKISSTYIQGWWFNLKNFDKIIEQRKWVQENRVISDRIIIKRMYFGFGKLSHLFSYARGF